MILNPNCSEIVFSIIGMPPEQVKQKLDELGVSMDDYPFSRLARGDYATDDDVVDGVEFMIGDCDYDFFPGALKIEKAFPGEWVGYDGGSLSTYENWKLNEVDKNNERTRRKP